MLQSAAFVARVLAPTRRAARPGAFMRSETQSPSLTSVGAPGGPVNRPFGPTNHGDHGRTEEQERDPGDEKRREGDERVHPVDRGQAHDRAIRDQRSSC
jgi:hypothetical protein